MTNVNQWTNTQTKDLLRMVDDEINGEVLLSKRVLAFIGESSYFYWGVISREMTIFVSIRHLFYPAIGLLHPLLIMLQKIWYLHNNVACSNIIYVHLILLNKILLQLIMLIYLICLLKLITLYFLHYFCKYCCRQR